MSIWITVWRFTFGLSVWWGEWNFDEFYYFAVRAGYRSWRTGVVWGHDHFRGKFIRRVS